MYLRNYGLRKRWLDKCLKIPLSEDHLTSNVVNGSKHCSMSTTAPLPYSLITVKLLELEKLTFSDMQSLKILC